MQGDGEEDDEDAGGPGERLPDVAAGGAAFEERAGGGDGEAEGSVGGEA